MVRGVKNEPSTATPLWEQVRDMRREISRLDRIQRADLGWVLPAVTEDTIDLLGPEPTFDQEDTPEAVEWYTNLLFSLESAIEDHMGTMR